MSTPDAALSGTFAIGGDLVVNRLGFGAMRITGRGIFGPPADHDEAIRVLKRLPEMGVNFIDTAESYGPNVSEELIREALFPYPDDLVIATKAGFQRSGPDAWQIDCRPDVLKRGLEGSLKRLGVEQIDLWQLHRIDSKVDRKLQFETIAGFRDSGKVRHVGLSEVSVADIEEAGKYVPIATVQNRYGPTDRHSDDVLAYCTEHNIGFIPWAPLGSGRLVRADSVLEAVARRNDATTSQVAIAWALQRSPVVLMIPGTSKVAHVEQNTAAAALNLSAADVAELDALG
ncbi:aldo/keto reductase [Devosia sp. CN2-171]|uniref:aldo/keto reductase n=1 Tax=Devosia sp. CN2-171 TaxID=3400909 RepID=UPI003BF8E9E9